MGVVDANWNAMQREREREGTVKHNFAYFPAESNQAIVIAKGREGSMAVRRPLI